MRRGATARRLDDAAAGFPGQRIGIDSNIEGFEEIVARAARAARDRRLELDDTTRANLAALGHVTPAPSLQTERRRMTDLLQVENLAISFNVAGGRLDAVRGVSFRVPQGGTVALVGESGSGKSVISQAIMGILPRAARSPAARSCSPIRAGPAARSTSRRCRATAPPMRAIRGGRISIIFQEPMTSLSPIHTIGDQIGEALHLHRKVEQRRRAAS